MLIYVTSDHSMLFEIMAHEEGIDTLECATVVLQEPCDNLPYGPVGFKLDHNFQIVSTLIKDVTALEFDNYPNWKSLREEEITMQTMSINRVVSCTNPKHEILSELAKVSENKLRSKKNLILARHGKPLLSMEATLFDGWIGEGNRAKVEIVEWLIDSCETLIFWRHSEWGDYAMILGRTAEQVLSPLQRMCEKLNIKMVQVETHNQLPVW
jgi:hypothetical protein